MMESRLATDKNAECAAVPTAGPLKDNVMTVAQKGLVAVTHTVHVACGNPTVPGAQRGWRINARKAPIEFRRTNRPPDGKHRIAKLVDCVAAVNIAGQPVFLWCENWSSKVELRVYANPRRGVCPSPRM